MSDTMLPAQRPARKRKAAADEPQEGAPEQDEFERLEEERLKRIERNRQELLQLSLPTLATQVFRPVQAPSHDGASAQPPPPAARRRAPAPPPALSRKSARTSSSKQEQDPDNQNPQTDEDTHERLFTQAEYLALQGKEVPSDAIHTDSHFRGWVSADIQERYGIASNASDAWEQNGGGTFTRRTDKAAVPSHLRKSGWSSAKAQAAAMLQKNPNQFFFRHTAPHLQQAKGPWTEEEHKRFLEVARQYGCGDKWGLFASHIGQRVGYQCRAYYTQFIIPAGLVIDSQFKVSRSGEAVWVGRGDGTVATETDTHTADMPNQPLHEHQPNDQQNDSTNHDNHGNRREENEEAGLHAEQQAGDQGASVRTGRARQDMRGSDAQDLATAAAGAGAAVAAPSEADGAGASRRTGRRAVPRVKASM